MDERNDEQTELLREIWNQMKLLDRTLGSRIDQTNANLLDLKQEVAGVKHEVVELKHEVAGVKHEVAGVKHEVAELRIEVHGLDLDVKALRAATHDGFELLARTDSRHGKDVAELRSRLERVEEHVGLRNRS